MWVIVGVIWQKKRSQHIASSIGYILLSILELFTLRRGPFLAPQTFLFLARENLDQLIHPAISLNPPDEVSELVSVLTYKALWYFQVTVICIVLFRVFNSLPPGVPAAAGSAISLKADGNQSLFLLTFRWTLPLFRYPVAQGLIVTGDIHMSVFFFIFL